MKISRVKYSHTVELQLEALEMLRSKSWGYETPIFSTKNGGQFHQLFDPSSPKASNGDPTAQKYFTCNHSYNNSFKYAKYLITKSNFVLFGNSRYQWNPEIISYTLYTFYVGNNQINQQVTISLFTDVLFLCCLLTDWDLVLIVQCTV